MAYKYDRKNRNVRLDDFEWDAFKDLLGAEWLRGKIEKAAKEDGRIRPAKPTKE